MMQVNYLVTINMLQAHHVLSGLRLHTAIYWKII